MTSKVHGPDIRLQSFCSRPLAHTSSRPFTSICLVPFFAKAMCMTANGCYSPSSAWDYWDGTPSQPAVSSFGSRTNQS